jgi:hypothetical protein
MHYHAQLALCFVVVTAYYWLLFAFVYREDDRFEGVSCLLRPGYAIARHFQC